MNHGSHSDRWHEASQATSAVLEWSGLMSVWFTRSGNHETMLQNSHALPRSLFTVCRGGFTENEPQSTSVARMQISTIREVRKQRYHSIISTNSIHAGPGKKDPSSSPATLRLVNLQPVTGRRNEFDSQKWKGVGGSAARITLVTPPCFLYNRGLIFLQFH